jgi:hypothetical protein
LYSKLLTIKKYVAEIQLSGNVVWMLSITQRLASLAIADFQHTLQIKGW